MKLTFKKIILHNFFSYSHAEIELQDKNYCIIKGENRCSDDLASSNGSGKSTIGSAICWALTGQTVQGISQNVKNIKISENLCYVTLFFDCDEVSYEITRQKNPKPYLKLLINGEDVSGKGLRESETILQKYLPDVTSDFLASLIILGQGLPHKFTDNTPSGRKEMLEKLVKSDFMIEDLKTRQSARLEELSSSFRSVEDILLKLSTEQQLLITQKEKTAAELEKISRTQIDTSKISQLQDQINKNIDSICNFKNEASVISDDALELKMLLETYSKEKDTQTEEENKRFAECVSSYYEKRSGLTSKIQSLNSEIQKLESISDICPTCGQKIPNIIKPDTSEKKKELQDLTSELTRIDSLFKQFSSDNKNVLLEISTSFKEKTADISRKLARDEEKISAINQQIQKLELESTKLQAEISKINFELNFRQKTIDNYTIQLSEFEQSLEKIVEQILYNTNEKQKLESRIAIQNQFSTLLKRDFRGYLLSNVISYISNKSKEYCQDIFENKNLEFCLSGNNIDISYCGKNFENLSGGEQQKIDLIIQFAIRDMMQTYSNFSCNILFLDEVTDSLDAFGCGKVIDLLSKKLTDIESLFFISHRADELDIPFDSELIVRKDENGISSVVSLN